MMYNMQNNGGMPRFNKDLIYEAEKHDLLKKFLYSEWEKYGAWIEEVEYKDNPERQRKGIDVILHKPDGSDAYIDEKARIKPDKGTFGLEIWNDYGGKGNFTDGWFMDESKKTGTYCLLYTENNIDYATFVNVKALKDKVFSIFTKIDLLNFHDEADKAVKSKLPGAFIFDSKKQWEHGRFLVLPLEFYYTIPSTMTFALR